jgi:hypothetical protein
MIHLLLTLAVLFLAVSFGCRQDPAPPVDQGSSGNPATASGQDRSSGVEGSSGLVRGGDPGRLPIPADGSEVKVVNTGDSDFWQSYDFPLVIRVEVPEVPETITEPSPPVPDRVPDEEDG